MNKKTYAKVLAYSQNEQGDKLITFEVQFPRIVLAEFNTHRMFSKNSASSRAIPFKKMVEKVMNNPFIPIAWQKEHKGMQGTQYLNNTESKYAIETWLKARDKAVENAKLLNDSVAYESVTKQICNRLLEPFMYHKVLITTGMEGLNNFFDLRCPQYAAAYLTPHDDYVDVVYRSKKETRKHFPEVDADPNDVDDDGFLTPVDWLEINNSQAEIHIQELAECMYDALNEAKPKLLQPGEWHIPFGDSFDLVRLNLVASQGKQWSIDKLAELMEESKVKIAAARCARISYDNFEGKNDYEADIKLYDRLSTSGHWSPFEHVAQCMTNKEYEEYYKGKLELTWLQDSDHEFEGEFYEPDITDKNSKKYHGWCRNYKGFIQLREKLD